MIKLDRDYSDYTDLSDENYPNGKAVDCSTDESYDGTPILQSLVNDVKGALESVVYQAEGSLNKVSGNPDNIAASDFLNALKKLISTPDDKHAALRGSDAHGATTTASAGQLMSRDSNGRSQVAAPSADADISTKKYVDDVASAAKNLGNATGTLAVAKGGTGATSAADARTNLGVPPTSHASSGTSYGVSSATDYGHAKASSTTPKANGTASAGSETSSFARGDHVHPVQTTVSGNAGSATKLATARKLKVALGSTTDKTFNGTADVTDIPVNGTLPVANGGTGATSAADARTNLGVPPTSHASSGTSYGVSSATNYGHAKASSTTPKANGTASVGSETSSFARGDHVHPESYSVPIGFVYFQLPGELAPDATDANGNALMFPKTYTWKDITSHYKGLFFRAGGGNAKSFDTCNYEIETNDATTVKLKKVPSGISVGDTVVCYNDTASKTRTVTAISTSTLTFSDDVGSVKYTNVLITQSDMNKSHGHVIGGNSQFQYVNLTYRDGSGLNIKGSNGTPDLPIQALSDGGIEARPVNISIKIWKRTN